MILTNPKKLPKDVKEGHFLLSHFSCGKSRFFYLVSEKMYVVDDLKLVYTNMTYSSYRRLIRVLE